MKEQPQIQASGASETTRFFCTQISPAAGAAGELKQHKKESSHGQQKYESRHRRKCRFRSLWIYCVSRFADSEEGRVGRVRRVGQWFLGICFGSFAQDLAAPSARSFAHKSESQNAMHPARSFRAGFNHTICMELCAGIRIVECKVTGIELRA